jgi:hypothetical protein
VKNDIDPLQGKAGLSQRKATAVPTRT